MTLRNLTITESQGRRCVRPVRRSTQRVMAVPIAAFSDRRGAVIFAGTENSSTGTLRRASCHLASRPSRSAARAAASALNPGKRDLSRSLPSRTIRRPHVSSTRYHVPGSTATVEKPSDDPRKTLRVLCSACVPRIFARTGPPPWDIRRHREQMFVRPPLPQELGAVALQRQVARPVGTPDSPSVRRIDLVHRSRCCARRPPRRTGRRASRATAPPSAWKRAPRKLGAGRGMRRSALRSTAGVRHLRGRALQHARACGARRCGLRAARAVMSIHYVHAGVGLGKTGLRSLAWAGNVMPDRKVLTSHREVHVPLRRGAQGADRALAMAAIDDLQFLQQGASSATRSMH